MNFFSNLVIIVWPVAVSLLAVFFHRKQNSQNAWTGGPISWIKSYWLAYTTATWFLLPIVIVLHPEFPKALSMFYIGHLLSWWIRGPLELVMIYKWFNWTPRYGISHDAFHILAGLTILMANWTEVQTCWDSNFGILALVFAGMILFTTFAEILFATLFLKFRSKQEESQNIYFASDDPKWILINRVTLTVVVIAMGHLILQSYMVLKNVL